MSTDPRASPLTLALARSVGFSVEEVLAAAGLSATVEAPEASLDALVDALESHYAEVR